MTLILIDSLPPTRGTLSHVDLIERSAQSFGYLIDSSFRQNRSNKTELTRLLLLPSEHDTVMSFHSPPVHNHRSSFPELVYPAVFSSVGLHFSEAKSVALAPAHRWSSALDSENLRKSSDIIYASDRELRSLSPEHTDASLSPVQVKVSNFVPTWDEVKSCRKP